MTFVDPHTRSRPDLARVRHLSLDLSVDFDARVLRVRAALDVEGPGPLVLDTWELAIAAVRDAEGRPLEWSLGDADPLLGAAMTIALPAGVERVVVDYQTSPRAQALQWLAPEQTAGAHPFLFTQGHAVHTRSWIPIQDSPALRFTYDARVSAPAPLVALMSAERTGREPSGAFAFRMPEPIPGYLIALAVGELASRELGPRTAVFAEPSLLERAAWEFAEVEGMIDAAERLVGPYLWGRFDVLLMPQAFPYGGMENPRLTFASSTLLAGDRSLTTVLAHELAHAWAGNLVVNATWDDFWINEGTTVYLELRINEVLWGLERAALLRAWGHRELEGAVRGMGESSPDTRLRYDMRGRDPSEGVTVIPYLKGAAFFWALEERVGRPRLDAWLRSWFERKAFQSVTTAQLLDDVRARLLREGEAIDLDRWVDAPGMPEGGAPPTSALLDRVEAAVQAVRSGAAPASLDTAGWSPQAWRHFLGGLLGARLSLATVEALDATFRLSESRNAEVLTPWLRIEAQVERPASAERIERFLVSQGRYKYLRPLYGDLLATAWGAPIARRAYDAGRGRYHAVVRSGLDKLLAR